MSSAAARNQRQAMSPMRPKTKGIRSPTWSERSEARRAKLDESTSEIDELSLVLGLTPSRRKIAWTKWADMSGESRTYADAWEARRLKDPKAQTLEVQLMKDIDRTLTAWSAFGDNGKKLLLKFLGAGATKGGDYVQGQNYLAAFVLLVMAEAAAEDDEIKIELDTDTEVQAFNVYTHFLQLLNGYYAPGFPHHQRDVLILKNILEQYLPETLDALTKSGAEPLTWAPRLFLQVFLNTLPGHICVRIWDQILFTHNKAAAQLITGHPRGVHSDAASATIIWTCCALLANAASDINDILDLNSSHPARSFIQVQNCIIHSAYKIPSWTALAKKAPLSLDMVAIAICKAVEFGIDTFQATSAPNNLNNNKRKSDIHEDKEIASSTKRRQTLSPQTKENIDIFPRAIRYLLSPSFADVIDDDDEVQPKNRRRHRRRSSNAPVSISPPTSRQLLPSALVELTAYSHNRSDDQIIT